MKKYEKYLLNGVSTTSRKTKQKTSIPDSVKEIHKPLKLIRVPVTTMTNRQAHNTATKKNGYYKGISTISDKKYHDIYIGKDETW